MVLEDWSEVTAALPPDTPVVFYNASTRPLEPEGYGDGTAVFPSRMWTARDGWVPCVTVELHNAL